MDIVLEVFDTFVFDRIYATLLPASPAAAQLPLNASKNVAADATFSSMRELPTAYQYHAASQYLQFRPSPYAYLSQLPRDNIYRQAITFYLITWYELPCHYPQCILCTSS